MARGDALIRLAARVVEVLERLLYVEGKYETLRLFAPTRRQVDDCVFALKTIDLESPEHVRTIVQRLKTVRVVDVGESTVVVEAREVIVNIEECSTPRAFRRRLVWAAEYLAALDAGLNSTQAEELALQLASKLP